MGRSYSVVYECPACFAVYQTSHEATFCCEGNLVFECNGCYEVYVNEDDARDCCQGKES